MLHRYRLCPGYSVSGTHGWSLNELRQGSRNDLPDRHCAMPPERHLLIQYVLLSIGNLQLPGILLPARIKITAYIIIEHRIASCS